MTFQTVLRDLYIWLPWPSLVTASREGNACLVGSATRVQNCGQCLLCMLICVLELVKVVVWKDGELE